MQNAESLAAEVQARLPNVKKGSLQFWGIWFGRPYDNYHVIRAARAEGDCLVLDFEDQDRLLVWHPRAAKISDVEFSVFNASRVRWEWYYAGRPATPGNLMVWDFEFNEGDVKLVSTFPEQFLQKPNPHAAAVIIH